MSTHVSDYRGPLANFPLERTGPANASYRGWRKRRLVPEGRMSTAEYSISGTNSDPDFPYVGDVPSLREAISIGRRYPGIYNDGAATHIVRRMSSRKTEDPARQWTGLSHRWRVFPDGRIELLLVYRSTRPQKARRGFNGWFNRLECPPAFYRDDPVREGKPLATELSDLLDVARKVGYSKAAEALRPLIVEANLATFPPRA